MLKWEWFGWWKANRYKCQIYGLACSLLNIITVCLTIWPGCYYSSVYKNVYWAVTKVITVINITRIMVLSNNLSLCQLFALIFCLSLKSDGSPAPGSELRTNTIMWYSSQRPIILPGVGLCQYYSWHTRNVNMFYTKYMCITVSLLKISAYFWLFNPAYCIFRSRSIVLTTEDHYLRSIPWVTPDWWPQGLVTGDIRWWG